MKVGPAPLWLLSQRLHQRGHRRLARAAKLANYLCFRAILPPEARVDSAVLLEHYGLGIVVHPNSVLGQDCQLWHHVTLAVMAPVGGDVGIVLGPRVSIGAGSTVIARQQSGTLEIGEGTVIGAGSVVTRSLPAHVVAAGNPAQVIRVIPPAEQ
jgi:serine O-acetyltransferase